MHIKLLKNRTSTMTPAKTAGKIEELLAQAGATHIVKIYEAAELRGIEFAISTDYGVIQFRMPVNVEAAYSVLKDARRGYSTTKQREALRQQAARTAWKLCLEDVELQLSKVMLKQAELTQVLFPYVVKDGVTLFEFVKADGYRMLTAPKDAPTQEIID